MDHTAQHALDQLELAEAELAVLKQEQVLRELLRMGEPTAEGTALLRDLQATVERMMAQSEERRMPVMSREQAV